MEAEDDHPAVPDHKLCGFLCAVLTVTSSPSPDDTPPLGTPFHIFRENSSVGFRSHAGDFVLSPVNLPPRCEETPASEKEDASGSEENRKRKPEKKRKKKGSGSGGGGGGSKTTRRKRSVGMVNGSMSVVEQLHALVTYKCLRIETRLVWAEAAAVGGEVRVVLLVDVHLPIELWSGWQFPKCGSVAGALFRHLSCDWKRRSSMMASADCAKDALRACRGVWNLSDCHVLGCKLHYNITDSSKKRLFELHDIFKSLPSVANTGYPDSSRVQPVDNPCRSGIWELTDDMLINILAALGPLELVRIAATCRHLRFLAALIMPCLKLKLFPHQQAAVQWMLRREQHAEVLPHPLYTAFLTEDGFSFYISTITGEIVSDVAPTITDFRGGMFCDEPGLGKTITALSLILKTRGKLADPPDGVKVQWCTHNGDPRCCYYDLGDDSLGGDYCAGTDMTPQKRDLGEKVQTSPEQLGCYSSKRGRLIFLNEQVAGVINLCSDKQVEKQAVTCSETAMPMVPCTRNLSSIKKNLISSLEGAPCSSKEMKAGKNSSTVKHASDGLGHVSWENQEYVSNELSHNSKRRGKVRTRHYEYSDTWVQCDACRKWRKLQESWISDATAAWFCSMNPDPQYQSCNVPEETWNNCGPIMYLPGFYTKGKSDGEEQNKTFFLSVLREHKSAINSATKKALSWLVKLSPEKLSEMETIGVRGPLISTCLGHGEDALAFHRIFQSFGLRKGGEKGNVRWYYPQNLHNLVFDVAALRKALCEPLDSIRLYLSKATLIVVPANLVDHWRTQIQKHVSSGQLRLHIWTDHKKSSVHSLAWDYDVVITTFSRLSAEWSSRKKSILMQIHWLRVILDEGHTLGSSVGLTNKLQMAVSLIASNRWILTGTPTPNTPNSQLSHLQPLLKFLHEEAYGQNQKSWEAGILRPFEAEMEEGRSRLLHLLNRSMISARKADLRNIPPCIKKVTLLDFTGEHARSYNELVVTVRRNILMADWNDDSHVESLLNRKQWKFRSTTIRNIRLSCCVAGHIKVTDAGQDIQETMDVLVEDGLDPMSEQYAFIKYNLLNGGNCVRCGEWCRLPVITPCRHLLCLDCVALDSERCTYPGCGNLYEMETPDALARPENPEPKWPVPKNLIELQPSYKQDNWDPDWQSTSSSKVAYLIRSLKELQNADSEAHLPKEDGTDVENIQGILYTSWTRNYNINTHKVLVFSQFLEHIHVIEQQLTIADIKFAGMYSPMHSSNKMKSLTMFQNDASCMVLLMDGSAALGLDLSFVSHVFLMEPIWNRSLEEQVISRAHRMGATRPIYVETLAMRSTIEEQMLAFLQDPDECRRILKQELGNTDSEVARTHRSLHDFAEKNYLSQLRFMRTNPIT